MTTLPTVRAYRDEFEGLIPAYDDLQESMAVAETQTRGFGDVMNRNLPTVQAWSRRWRTMTVSHRRATEKTQTFEASLNDLAGALGDVGDTLGDSAGEVFQWGASVVTAMNAAKQSGAPCRPAFKPSPRAASRVSRTWRGRVEHGVRGARRGLGD